MISFATWMENLQNTLNFRKNKDAVLKAFEIMEGSWILNEDGAYSIKGAIKWLETVSENHEGDFTIYGGGGINRYFVYPNGDVIFSEYHAKFPKEKSTSKAVELGFKIQ
jgi:hypothetical protein